MGLPGSGKSSLAQKISDYWNLVHLESDAILQNSGTESYLSQVSQLIQQRRWVFEGHFQRCGSLVLPQAEAIVWVDPPAPVIIWRCAAREISRQSRWYQGLQSQSTFRYLLSNWYRLSEIQRNAMSEARVPVFSSKQITDLLNNHS